MAVIDLAKLVSMRLQQVFSRDSPVKVGVVDMGNAPLTPDRIYVSLDRLGDTVATLGTDQFLQVESVNMNGTLKIAIRNLFAGNEDELIGGPIDGIQSLDRKSTRLNSSHVKISYAV